MELLAHEKEHLATLRQFLPECMVLLKKNGAFPLPEAGPIALYGSGARRTVKGGTGSGEVNSHFFVNVEDGLKEAGFSITTEDWLDAYEEEYQKARIRFFRDVKEEARKNHTNAIMASMGAVMPEPDYELPLTGEGNTAVYVLSRISGEGNDRKAIPGDILLSETEIRDILACNEKYERFMLVLNVGGPVDLTPVLSIGNILLISQLGVETGAALSDVLLGKAAPSGKLSTSWAAAEDYPAIGDFGDLHDTHYREGIYVGYRYFDSTGKEPLFPFGFGLSYTEFRTETLYVRQQEERIIITVRVTNIGDLPGKEVVQAYVSCPSGKLDREYQSLAAFMKTRELLPGEEETADFDFCFSDLAGYDAETASYILEAGPYVLRVGNSSRNTSPAAILRLYENVTVRTAENVLGDPGFTDWKPEDAEAAPLPPAPEIPLNPVFFVPAAAEEEEVQIPDQIRSLMDEELAYLEIGSFNPKGGLTSIIGSAGSRVPGSAGETTSVLLPRGIPVLTMADGPAGLRLSREYFEDEKGVYASGSMLPESMMEALPKAAKTVMNLLQKKAPKGAEKKHIYTSAIPIGTAVAESWNTDFAYRCGDIVGSEMLQYGVHLWLAPALNIHRDIRCGRNFEYFSEDPFLSGVFAAAITNGVQKHPGCGVTVKHYAANNQETNRYNNSSHVSERAMREIYLKGFGICVRNSSPKALMTSYNLLNGVHTSEHPGLIGNILRDEFGYRGIVMTDWIVAAMMKINATYPGPKASGIAAAGGDLVMPGSIGDYKELLSGLRHGRIGRKQLEMNASRILKLALELTKAQEAVKAQEAAGEACTEAAAETENPEEESEG